MEFGIVFLIVVIVLAVVVLKKTIVISISYFKFLMYIINTIIPTLYRI